MTVFSFFTNGLHMEDGEVIGPSKFEPWRYAFCVCMIFQQKMVFRPVDVVMFFCCRATDFSKTDPEGSGSGRGASPTH